MMGQAYGWNLHDRSWGQGPFRKIAICHSLQVSTSSNASFILDIRLFMRNLFVLICCLLSLSVSLAECAEEQPICLQRAHAHNDYAHKRPLQDALDCGFCSVEADIFLIDGELLVGHSRSELTAERTLQALYLEPLWKRCQANGGRVYRDGPQFMLLIDIKNQGEQCYLKLATLLKSYESILSKVEQGVFVERGVQVVISGDRPVSTITRDKDRLVGIDGRLSDLNSDLPSSLLPLISDRWGKHFKWNGRGEIGPDEKHKLTTIVKQAHQAGRRIRFWATPESEAVWKVLYDAEVDHINTDLLKDLQLFLEAR